MKCFTLVTLASAIMLGGCASTNQSPNGASARSEDSYIPLGTLIARKTPNRAERSTEVDKQALENERIMGGANRDGQR
jgi:hypothetical protein